MGSIFLVDILLIITALYYLIGTKNILCIFINSYVLLYSLNTTVINFLLDIPFSPQQGKFESTYNITLSLLVFLVVLNFIIAKIEINFSSLRVKKNYNRKDIVKSMIIIGYALFLLYQKGFRLNGDFVEFIGQRAIYEDYVQLIFIMFFISSRASKPLILAFTTIALTYFLAGERMRMFIYAGTVALYLYNHRIRLIKIFIPLSYAFAEIISIFRSATSFGIREDGTFVSHFGSVSISSLYMIEYANSLSWIERFQYFIGLILGNFLPSSLLPNGWGIREDLFNAHDIPGGGWFTVFIQSLVGWPIFILVIILIIICLKKLCVNNSLSNQYLLFFIIITSPRWFMYSPYLIFRFAIYCYIILILIKFLNEKKSPERAVFNREI